MESKRLKVIAAVLAGTVLLAGLLLLFVVLTGDDPDQEPLTYYLGELGRPGYAGVELTYDVEPMGLVLISPSGRQYVQPNASGQYKIDVYEVDESSRTITAKVDTEELGGWSVRFPRLGNGSIGYRFLSEQSTTLRVLDPAITESDGKYWFGFLPDALPSGSDGCAYELHLERDGTDRIIGTGEVRLNEESKVEIVPPADAYDGGTYDIRIVVVCSPDGRTAQTASAVLRAVLQPGGR